MRSTGFRSNQEPMEPKERLTPIQELSDLPSIDALADLPRGINWKFVFSDAVANERELIGAKWKHSLPDFSVAIHTSAPIIQWVKLITDDEVHAHQDFFEQCAKDYGQLAESLIKQLIDTHNIPFTPEFPLVGLNAYLQKAYPTTGKMQEWAFRIHGFHCAFTHQSTEQHIEVPLTFGEEFGVLDPYFFSNYILSSPQYAPLPVALFDPYGDGNRILEVMQVISKFEEVPSNVPGQTGIIVSDREKKEITISEEGLQAIIQQVVPKNGLLDFWRRFLGLWKK